jgi:hypothetical protein
VHQSIPTDEVDGDGLALWVTIILPSLVWTAHVDTIDRGSWIGFGFWALQIFVQSMLIGLVAGDRDFAHLWGRRGPLLGAEVCRGDSDGDQAPDQIRDAAAVAGPASRPADKVSDTID